MAYEPHIIDPSYAGDPDASIPHASDPYAGDIGMPQSSTMTVFVETNTERIITFRVQPTSTIDQFKDMIEEEEGIPSDRQRLIYAGRQLEDDRTLEYYGIPHEGTLTLVLRLMREKSIAIGENLPGCMQIFAQTTRGTTITIYIQPTATTDQLMCIIRDGEGIPLDKQRIIYRGKQLEPGRTLEDYMIVKESTIHLVPRAVGGGVEYGATPQLVHLPEPIKQIKPFIQREGASSKSQYIVGEPFTVDSLMGMIQTREGVRMDRQMLSFNGVELKEFSTLVEYGVKDGDAIVLTILRRKTWSKFW